MPIILSLQLQVTDSSCCRPLSIIKLNVQLNLPAQVQIIQSGMNMIEDIHCCVLSHCST